MTTLSEYLASHQAIELAILFGSFATTAARPDSDVDIGVLCRDARLRLGPMSVDRKLALIEGLAMLTGRAVDLVDLADAGIPILEAVLTTGRTLFARHADARSDLLVRYLIDAADFGPYYERILRERRATWIG